MTQHDTESAQIEFLASLNEKLLPKGRPLRNMKSPEKIAVLREILRSMETESEMLEFQKQITQAPAYQPFILPAVTLGCLSGDEAFTLRAYIHAVIQSLVSDGEKEEEFKSRVMFRLTGASHDILKNSWYEENISDGSGGSLPDEWKETLWSAHVNECLDDCMREINHPM